MLEITYNEKIINTQPITVFELFKDEIKEKGIIACRFNNEVKSLNYKIEENGKIELIDISNKDGMRIYRRGLIYILSKAFEELYPNAKTAINYQLSNSMLCEVIDAEVNDEMITKINDKFKEIVEKDIPIIKKIMTKKEAKEYYKANENQFMAGETVHAKHILVDDEDKCQEILEKIIGEETTFEDAAKEFSTCPSKEKGGDLGAFGRGQMVKEFDEAVFTAEVGKVIGPVKTDFGYHLIRVDELTGGEQSEFAEVYPQIMQQLTTEKQNKKYMAVRQEMIEKYGLEFK